MTEDFTMPCVECLLHHPYKHAEPWTCPACGLIHAVVMPGVPLATGPEKRPVWMTPEREEAIEDCLILADHWSDPRLYTSDDHDACDMAVDAFRAAELPDPGGMIAVWLRNEYLEASALLRDGWNPGDPVVRRC